MSVNMLKGLNAREYLTFCARAAVSQLISSTVTEGKYPEYEQQNPAGSGAGSCFE